jgi:flagellar protein FlbD
MIALQKLNGQEFVLNADYIEMVESTPDTVLSLTNGKKLIVKNSVEDIVRKVVEYKQLCNHTLSVITRNRDHAGSGAAECDRDASKGGK